MSKKLREPWRPPCRVEWWLWEAQALDYSSGNTRRVVQSEHVVARTESEAIDMLSRIRRIKFGTGGGCFSAQRVHQINYIAQGCINEVGGWRNARGRAIR